MTRALWPRESGIYVDLHGRSWSTTKLDAMLTDENVLVTVLSALNIGLKPDGTWIPGAVFGWAKLRYPREAVACLVVLLVTHYLDTDGARYLTRESAA